MVKGGGTHRFSGQEPAKKTQNHQASLNKNEWATGLTLQHYNMCKDSGKEENPMLHILMEGVPLDF